MDHGFVVALDSPRYPALWHHFGCQPTTTAPTMPFTVSINRLNDYPEFNIAPRVGSVCLRYNLVQAEITFCVSLEEILHHG